MQVDLKVVLGEDAGRKFTLDRLGTVVVGRGAADDVEFRVCAADRRFSRYHFLLEATRTACYVRDLRSCNGTYVNGKRVRAAQLADGDEVHCAKKTLFVKFLVTINPLAGARFQEPWVDSERGQADVSDMVTLPIGRAAAQRAVARTICPVCGEEPPEDAWIRDVLKAVTPDMVAYVCPKHSRELTDAGHPIPNYEVLDVLGEGAVGPVYKARRVSSDKLVALKVVPDRLTSDREVMEVFQRHMRLSARLRSAHIAEVIEMGQAGEQLWLATECVEGLDALQLADSLSGPLPLADAVEITCQTLSALDCVHELNLVHRDVKPSNIMVAGAAGQYVAKLADFVLVKDSDEAVKSLITQEDVKRGTVAFMAPEQVIDSRTAKYAADIYGAGATLYWLLTGKFVYDFGVRDRRGEPKEPYRIILEDRQIPIRERSPAVPRALAQVIERALNRDPEHRFPSARQMAAALRESLAT